MTQQVKSIARGRSKLTIAASAVSTLPPIDRKGKPTANLKCRLPCNELVKELLEDADYGRITVSRPIYSNCSYKMTTRKYKLLQYFFNCWEIGENVNKCAPILSIFSKVQNFAQTGNHRARYWRHRLWLATTMAAIAVLKFASCYEDGYELVPTVFDRSCCDERMYKRPWGQ
jgi:hypothetical protein